jgi:hypothetical protein
MKSNTQSKQSTAGRTKIKIQSIALAIMQRETHLYNNNDDDDDDDEHTSHVFTTGNNKHLMTIIRRMILCTNPAWA